MNSYISLICVALTGGIRDEKMTFVCRRVDLCAVNWATVRSTGLYVDQLVVQFTGGTGRVTA
jgi:hypothetical protein